MINDSNFLRIGLDVGSTTAKIAILNKDDELIFSDYLRHNAKIPETVATLLHNAAAKIDITNKCSIFVTGSAGLGIAERAGLPFIQEVIAAAAVIDKKYPTARTLLDVGGEDTKMIFFAEGMAPDIRMNGSCAGGTGAFIDQMASLLNVSIKELDALAAKHDRLYPVASRCGVFAKTDIQNLLGRKVSLENIAASIFHAVALQVLNSLARGFTVQAKVVFCGGPLTFLPYLRETFKRVIGLSDQEVIVPPEPALLPAIGAAMKVSSATPISSFSELLKAADQSLVESTLLKNSFVEGRLPPLFSSAAEFSEWEKQRFTASIKKIELADYPQQETFLGIDSGSTTTKICLTGWQGELLFSFYKKNSGNPIESVKEGLQQLAEIIKLTDKKITYTAVTGYGEDLVRAAYNIDLGLVETMAHFFAAHHFDPKVSFIMDIGGQDMKAVFVSDGIINRLELNESCSAGCGSFVENFSTSLGYSIEEFARAACLAEDPCDLGTRCTVFMNSKVKQALRENASVGSISAGLAVSVLKNALFKVLQITDYSVLGSHIVVQGGTFKNPAIQRAMEVLTGQKVICSDIPELMGAYGASLAAAAEYQKMIMPQTTFIGLKNLCTLENYETSVINCHGCENFCAVTRFIFGTGNLFFSGNKCEKIFSNRGKEEVQGFNFLEYKNKLLFERSGESAIVPANGLRIGVPRVLNMYENFPFWNELLTNCGYEVVLSASSTMKLYEKGQGTIMSDNICFPAKIVHGHIIDLAEKKVDRIFYPQVIFEKREHSQESNTFNCPIVSSYVDVIRSSVNPTQKYQLPLDAPVINFDDNELLKRSCSDYLLALGITKKTFEQAFNKALSAREQYRQAIKNKAAKIIKSAEIDQRLVVVLAGRPYHADPLINHKTPEIITAFGADVLSEDAVAELVQNKEFKDNWQVLPQWSYPNRIYQAAQWSTLYNNRVQFVQFNSFGCGPDAIACDEASEILAAAGKKHTLVRIDEITSTGSVKLRIRSMLESVKLSGELATNPPQRATTAIFSEEDAKKRILLAPYFADVYSDLLPAIFGLAGYQLVNLPKPDKASVEYGLKYCNNEICYPATIVIGDVIKALASGQYPLNKVAIAITQTGGQCRASNYLALIKKGILAAGYGEVPVVSVNAGDLNSNEQPGFKINWSKIVVVAFNGVLFADVLNKFYYATVSREINKGSALLLRQKYVALAIELVKQNNSEGLFTLMAEALEEFNQLPIKNIEIPRVGIVGEIYVKYNSFGHQFILDWLIANDIEVVVPPIIDFFMQPFVNVSVNKRLYVKRVNFVSDIISSFIERKAFKLVARAQTILEQFRLARPFTNIRESSILGEKILSLASQFGEGWLLPAEIAEFAEEGLNNVISVQPFGCIANHVIAKGVEKRIKDLYPKMNLLFLDFDGGTSEVNILNRLHFMAENVKK